MPHDILSATKLVYEMLESGDTSRAGEIIDANVIDHQPFPGLEGQGIERIRQLTKIFHASFSNLHFTLDDVIVDGEKVAVRGTMSGDHTGEFMGIQPTGKSFSIAAIDIMRFANGLCVEHWGITDDVSMMTQLGLMPGPQ